VRLVQALVGGIDDGVDLEVPGVAAPEVDPGVDLLVDGEPRGAPAAPAAGVVAGERVGEGEEGRGLGLGSGDGGDSEEMRWSGSLQRGTWSSVTAGSTPPTPGAMAAAAAAATRAR